MAKDRSHDLLATFPEVQLIGDPLIKDGVLETYQQAMDLASVDDLGALPFTTTYGTRVPYPVHVRAITGMAIAIGRVLMKGGMAIDMDVLIAGALLHDVGKVMEFREGAGPYCGTLVKHTFSGAALAQEVGLPAAVLHCIIYHSYEGEGRRRSVESVIVHHCDFIHFEANRALEELY